MKRVLMLLFSLIILSLICSVRVSAEQVDVFDEEIQQLDNSIPESVSEDMDRLGAGSVEDIISGGVDNKEVFSYIGDLIAGELTTPFAALLILISVIILASVAESYSVSLRYTDTKEIMEAVLCLFIVTVAVNPMSKLAADSVTVLKNTSFFMLLYLPVTAGIMAFSGHLISSAGYYTAVISVSQLIAWLSSSVLSVLLNVFLSLSVSAGICARLRLRSLIEMAAKGFRYTIAFAMSIFVGVLGLNGALASAGDTLAGRATKYTLSSFIPIIGSSIAEAYSTLKGSVQILRSGLGVLVIVAVFIMFAPLLIRTIIWSVTVSIAIIVSETFSVGSAGEILHTLASFLSSLRVLLICVMTVFIISSSVMMSVGGHS